MPPLLRRRPPCRTLTPFPRLLLPLPALSRPMPLRQSLQPLQTPLQPRISPAVLTPPPATVPFATTGTRFGTCLSISPFRCALQQHDANTVVAANVVPTSSESGDFYNATHSSVVALKRPSYCRKRICPIFFIQQLPPSLLVVNTAAAATTISQLIPPSLTSHPKCRRCRIFGSTATATAGHTTSASATHIPAAIRGIQLPDAIVTASTDQTAATKLLVAALMFSPSRGTHATIEVNLHTVYFLRLLI